MALPAAAPTLPTALRAAVQHLPTALHVAALSEMPERVQPAARPRRIGHATRLRGDPPSRGSPNSPRPAELRKKYRSQTLLHLKLAQIFNVLRCRSSNGVSRAVRISGDCDNSDTPPGRIAGGAKVPRRQAPSGPTRTNCLPKLAPFRSPMKASGALSMPSVTNSLYLTLPSRTHCDMSCRNSAWRAA